MGKIKSALELAMEQTADLKDQREASDDLIHEPYFKASALLADSFLKMQISPERVFETIGRYPEQARERAALIFLEKAAAGMGLEHCAGFAAVYRLFREGREEQLIEALEEVDRGYREKIQEVRTRAEEGRFGIQILAPLQWDGIAGSALAGVNLERSPWWQNKVNSLARGYAPPLNTCKEQLLAALKGAG